MARQQKLILVNAKMYRHFALVTIGLTGGIALFSDGEKREAVAQQVETVANYEPEKPKGPQLVIKNSRVQGSASMGNFYSGASSVNEGYSDGLGSYMPGGVSLEQTGYKVNYNRLAQLGLTKEQFDALSPAEREQVLIKLNGGITGAQRKKHIEGASSASLARSGGGTSEDY